MPISDAEAKIIADKVNDLVQESFHTGSVITVDIVVTETKLPKTKSKKILDALVKNRILCVLDGVYSANPKVVENLRKLNAKEEAS